MMVKLHRLLPRTTGTGVTFSRIPSCKLYFNFFEFTGVRFIESDSNDSYQFVTVNTGLYKHVWFSWQHSCCVCDTTNKSSVDYFFWKMLEFWLSLPLVDPDLNNEAFNTIPQRLNHKTMQTTCKIVKKLESHTHTNALIKCWIKYEWL